MDDQEKKQELIEQYLLGNLEGAALTAFEDKLKNDTIFARDVVIMKDMEEAFRDVPFEKELSQRLQFLGKKHLPDELAIATPSTPTPTIPFYKRKAVIGATVLALLLIGAVVIWSLTQKEADVYATYYEPYPTDALERGDNSLEETYKKALDFYDEQNYNAALPFLEQQVTALPDDAAMKILLANCYLNAKPPETSKAIASLQMVINGTDNLYHKTAQWYLALIYIKNEEVELAKPLLEIIAEEGVDKYSRLAKEVLKTL